MYKTEKKLFEYFCKAAGYNERMNIYECAGVYADDTTILFQKLKKEWEKDVKYHKTVEIPDKAKRLLSV